jgi:hypothetical protein
LDSEEVRDANQDTSPLLRVHRFYRRHRAVGSRHASEPGASSVRRDLRGQEDFRAGDHTRGNAYSRLRYHQMFAPKIVERITKSAPRDADLTSWRY